ncbi:hypothetical protein DES53_105188 [Roseimicrobium gellanilyticum]|uniref:J domain-containing protein n=1 Tax=Roseimicrobium gellanilyticum TaxID=748857 RepID=A0A366HLH3_9BACT|nr:hypothetical protein [Roseimicrobium gellanilyticum]RBP43789.1 hypothetical protein DES53_105188 [Roseimicrobium gellanilyticum]
MNDPWQVLILDRHTATEKDVKAAYARLLKQHRPDSDPEGFRRVREAYEAALNWLRHRASQSLPEVSYVDTPVGEEGAQDGGGQGRNRLDLPVVFEDFPLPAEAQEALTEVERAAKSGNTEQLEAALVAFHECCEAGAVSGETRVTALERALQGRVNDLASAVTNSFLIRMAELGQMNLPHLVVSAWQDADDRERLVQFSRALVENARTLATPDGAILLARVGVLTGLEQPEMASTLANAAYPHLPVEARNHLMAQLEQEAALGKIFAGVSPSTKPFWFKRLRGGDDSYDWNSAEARSAVNDIVERKRYVWEGWHIVKQLMPAGNWALVESRLHHQAQQAASSQQRSSSFPGWLVVPVILVVINMLRFMGSDKPSRVHSDSIPRPPAVTVPASGSSGAGPKTWDQTILMQELLAGNKGEAPVSMSGGGQLPVTTPPPAPMRYVPEAIPLSPLPDLPQDLDARERQFQNFLQNGTLPGLPQPGVIYQTR